MHLDPERLVDIAEGARTEASEPHLAGCDRCRRQLDDLRTMMTAVEAAEEPVPEPSPLFWDQLSDRVREAVAAEQHLPARRAWWREWVGRPAAFVPLAAAALVALVLFVRVQPPSSERRAAVSVPVQRELLDDLTGVDEDASLGFVADLTQGFDFDEIRDSGLAARGSAEHAVTHMSDAELRELQRLLQEQLSSAGN